MAKTAPATAVTAEDTAKTPRQLAAEAAAQAEADKVLMRNASPSQVQAAGIQNGMPADEICRRLRSIGAEG